MKIHCTFDPQTINHPIGGPVEELTKSCISNIGEFHCPLCHEIQFPGFPHTDNAASDFDVPNSGANISEMD